MHKYDIQIVADDLMLTAEDLQEIYELYFEEAADLMKKGNKAIIEQDYATAVQVMHALKGASANLRMEGVRKRAAELEQLLKGGHCLELDAHIRDLQAEMIVVKDYVSSFYSNSSL